MEIKQKYRFIVAFVLLFILLSLIQNTYAKYVSKLSGDTNITIARWGILLNNQDVNNNSDFSNTIVPIFPGTEHIASNILAPLSEGYFDIVVDASNVDVSFTQTLALNFADDNTVSDFIIVGYSVNNGDVIYFDEVSGTSIINDILLSDQVRINTYRIFVKWHDGVDETMDNQDDTQATIDGKASVKVDVSFIQKPN